MKLELDHSCNKQSDLFGQGEVSISSKFVLDTCKFLMDTYDFILSSIVLSILELTNIDPSNFNKVLIDDHLMAWIDSKCEHCGY